MTYRPSWCTKPFKVKVVAYDRSTLHATAIDESEIDDVVRYDISAPAHFGGATNPYPKVGEVLFIVYDRHDNRIVELWREQEEQHLLTA